MTDLLARTAELVAVASVSHHERALADLVEDRLRRSPWLAVDRVGDNVVARTTGGAPTRVVLAGHLDTVPADGNADPRIEGATLWGLGSADMKGGLAVMLELASHLSRPSVEVSWVFYAAEEVARCHNGLLTLAATRPDLLAGDVAILGEPTGAVVEAGCQGVVKMAASVTGRRAHTARPWMGVNAIHRLGPVLDRLAAWPGRTPTVEGCSYREALEAVEVTGGVASNVVPDRATVTMSHRFAPDRDAAAAEATVRAWLSGVLDAPGDGLTVLDTAPAARPGLDHPVLARLCAAVAVPPRAKLGWTDVAFFAGRGIPAVNFGPGDPELAHRSDERVERHELDTVLRVLTGLLG